MASVLNKWYSAWTQLKGFAGVTKDAFTGNMNTGNDYNNFFEKTLNSLGSQNEKILNTRIDSPLVYKESTPMEYNLTFRMSAYEWNEALVMHEMVNKLMVLSCPQKIDQQNIKIKPPHLFSIKSIQPNVSSLMAGDLPILNLKYTAITSIQPTYSAPYVGGLALNVALTIAFMDITPLFDTTFTSGAGVTASPITPTIKTTTPTAPYDTTYDNLGHQ
jgi:hypothetical protein